MHPVDLSIGLHRIVASLTLIGANVMQYLNINQWVELFKKIGLSEDQMSLWHQLFEKNHPEAHQAFFEWMHVEPEKIKELRKKFGN